MRPEVVFILGGIACLTFGLFCLSLWLKSQRPNIEPGESETTVCGVASAAHAGAVVVRRSTREQTRLSLSRDQCDLVLQLLTAENAKHPVSMPLRCFCESLDEERFDSDSEPLFVALSFAQLHAVREFATRNRLQWLADQLERV